MKILSVECSATPASCAIIDDGKIVAVGSHEELLRTCPSYEAMAELQRLEAEK